MANAIGIDIGGTKIAGGVVDDDGRILAAGRTPTQASDPDAIIDDVVAMVRSLDDGSISSVGVAAPGFFDATRSTVYYSPNIAWRNEPLQARLAARLPDKVVTIENDANAAGWAEFRFGAGREERSMVMVTIGTGVGGAIVLDDRLLTGGFGSGAELGHMRLIPDGLPCGCGARGCVEQYCSGNALLRLANEAADAGGDGAALARARVAAGGLLNGHHVSALLESGDPGALRCLNELADLLGQALASMSAILDPNIFVIGGGVAQAGDLLLDPVREAFLTHLPARGFHPEPSFSIAQLVNDAGVIGAGDLARSALVLG
ncbi:ROK family protein [Plantibacter sp. PA-3-X8]|uniref:Glucokinase n=1 Tax=Plantibacter cousiniae (nom. nud.) TaxID=199709 RepID=A0ABY1LMD0_9MICO|nr:MULTISPECIES: ROK family glucokinase [Plantibacter]AZH83991.1 ROK family protein [Plantibacter sp. PA-3-X8]MBD8103141.1 ROK family glucokinase [Plantibacter sp. CFBP 8775]SKC60852.1 glucokinase [Plantibacter cousiniae]